jgi:ADP-heptose:LPS heptosyltransferase
MAQVKSGFLSSPTFSHSSVSCLVIQLSGMADNLQSLMALRAAKQNYPDLKIAYLCGKKCSAAAQRVPWIDELFILPTEELLQPFFEGKKLAPELLADFAKWMSPMTGKGWDFVVNWTFSESSSFLTALFPARVKLGFSRRREKELSFFAADGWSHYMQAVIQTHSRQNIHVTDILTTQILTAFQIHLGPPVAEPLAFFPKNFFTLNVTTHQIYAMMADVKLKWLFIHIPSEQKNPSGFQWLYQNQPLADLIANCLQLHPHMGIFLVSDVQKSVLVHKVVDQFTRNKALNAASSGVPLRVVGVNAPSFDLLAGLVSRSQLVVGGDPTIVQLASILGTRTVFLANRPSDFEHFGPYGNNHFLIAASREPVMAFESAILADFLISIFDTFEHPRWSFEGYHLFRSQVRGSKEGGGVCYQNCTDPMLSAEQWGSLVVGVLARFWYCGWTPKPDQELRREAIGPELLSFTWQAKAGVQTLRKICQSACQITQEIERQAGASPSQKAPKKAAALQSNTRLTELSQQLQEVDQLMLRVVTAQPILRPFYEMTRVLMHHLESDHLASMGKEATEAYVQIQEGLDVFEEWIDFTLKLARPVVLKSGCDGNEVFL